MKLARCAVFILSAASSSWGLGWNQARAEDPPPPHHHGPPPEAFDACKDKQSGEACSVTFREHTITGTCDKTPDERLACRPDHPPPGPPPSANP